MKKILAILSLALLCLACEKTKNPDVVLLNSSEQTEQTTKMDTTKFKSCFEEIDYDLAKILSKQDVLKHFNPEDHAKIEIDERKGMGRQSHVIYKFKSNRQHTVEAGGMIQKIPDYNNIELSGLEFSKSDEAKTLENFDRKFKKLSEQELQDILTNLEKEFAGKSSEELEQAKRMMKIRTESNYVPVQGLGTAAYWQEFKVKGNNFGAELIVLAGNVEFTVRVKIDSDNMLNSQTAIAVANDILKKCN